APIQPGSPRKKAAVDKTAKIPKRKRSKAQQRAYRIAAERALNDAYVADVTNSPFSQRCRIESPRSQA
ncbi:MAG: hypothetical protein ABWY45_15045, partial [Mycobacterium sp.]